MKKEIDNIIQKILKGCEIMKERKIPMRTCVVTKEKLPKKELIRIVRNKEGEVFVDDTGKQNGKGVYLKLVREVVEEARNKKLLSKYLECEVKEEIYEELEKRL